MFIRFVQALVAVFLLALSVPCAAAGEVTGNLLVNGDAESHRCTSDWTAQSPVPGWRVVRGATSVLCYDAFAFTGVKPNLPPDLPAGHALFAAPGIDSAMEQAVDVSLAASSIDQGAVTYQLSGWLGGWSGRVQSALTIRATRTTYVAAGPRGSHFRRNRRSPGSSGSWAADR